MWNLYEIERENDHNIYLITFINPYGEDRGWYVDLVKYAEDLGNFIDKGIQIMWVLDNLENEFRDTGQGSILLENTDQEEIHRYLRVMQVVE